jgi:hypothetical protein
MDEPEREKHSRSASRSTVAGTSSNPAVDGPLSQAPPAMDLARRDALAAQTPIGEG